MKVKDVSAAGQEKLHYYLSMSTRLKYREPKYPHWTEAYCFRCGASCWETSFHRKIKLLFPNVRLVCYDCKVNKINDYQ